MPRTGTTGSSPMSRAPVGPCSDGTSISSTSVLGVRPLNPQEATANVESLLDRPHVRTAGEAEGFWKLFRATGQDRARGNDVPDAHLATLMRQNGVRVIYTRDRGFRRFPDIDAVDPFDSGRQSRRG